jgi:hypothetical protein
MFQAWLVVILLRTHTHTHTDTTTTTTTTITTTKTVGLAARLQCNQLATWWIAFIHFEDRGPAITAHG